MSLTLHIFEKYKFCSLLYYCEQLFVLIYQNVIHVQHFDETFNNLGNITRLKALFHLSQKQLAAYSRTTL